MYGLVLEGGGTKGSYHMGVYKAILEEGIDIKAVAGTSIGAINGAMIVQGDYELGLELWNKISYNFIIQANEDKINELINSKLNLEDFKYIVKKLRVLISDRGFDIGPLKEMLKKYIDEDKIRKSPMELGIVTVNFTDLIPMEVFMEDVPQGKIADFLLASSYLPIFRPERLGGKIYLDGGFYDNLPYKLLQRKGYKNLILVRTHAKGIIRRPPKDKNIITISPSKDIGKAYICDSEKAKENINMGYYDALKVFRGLKGEVYYIEPTDEVYYMNYLLGLDEKKIQRILDQLNINAPPTKRVLFEYIIPELGSFMGLDEAFSYEDIMINLLEKKAMELEIEEFAIYTFEELSKKIKNKKIFKKQKTKESSSMEKLLTKVDLVKLFNKDKIILEIADAIFI